MALPRLAPGLTLMRVPEWGVLPLRGTTGGVVTAGPSAVARDLAPRLRGTVPVTPAELGLGYVVARRDGGPRRYYGPTDPLRFPA